MSPIITLPYGEGLERSAGAMVVRPTSFDDLRNVHLRDGKAQARGGLTLASVLQDDGPTDLDVTVMLAALRSEAAAIGVGYNTTGGANREIWANRMTIDGTNPVQVGQLGTLNAGATFVPPIIVGADSDNRFFFAHDEPLISSRLVTQYYDPGTFPNLNNLQADLDGNGQADVFFRGVVRHLSYVFGWGYGSATDKNRGDVVRVSNSGDSTIFEDFAFFEAGQKGEVVMVCRSAGTSLMVFKETESYEIFGYSPDTFGIRLADSLFGCVGSRLAVSVSGTVFFWSTQGPRLTSGGPSEDIAVPLDIGGPDPSTLVAESEPQDAFAEYDPATRVVNFVWGQRVYALSIRNPNRPRWSYYELGETAQCGGLFFSTQSQAGGGGAPTGAPENLTFPNTTPISIDVLFDNISQTGGEAIEVHISSDGGTTYSLVDTVIANDLATQTITVTREQVGPDVNIQPLTDYKFSLRYRRGGLFAPGYTDANPDLWDTPTFASQGTETTPAAPLEFVTRSGDNQGVWSREAAGVIQIITNLIIPAGHELLDIEIEREIRANGDSAIQDLGGGTGPPDTADQLDSAFAPLSSESPGTTVFTDTAPTVRRFNNYRARFVKGAEQGSFGSTLSCWAGPDPPLGGSLMCSEGTGIPEASWTNATTPVDARTCPAVPPAAHSTEAWYKDIDLPTLWLNVATESPFSTGAQPEFADFLPSVPLENDDIRIGVRHQTTCFGTTDVSRWSLVVANPNYVLCEVSF